MAKTYVPTLQVLLRQLAIYMIRWRVIIMGGLTPAQVAAFTILEQALLALQEELGEPPINP